MATSQIEPPPTYADVLLKNAAGQTYFNPIWLKWFIDLAAVISNSGGSGGTITHNSLGGLQGGTANQYYHMTSNQHDAVFGGSSSDASVEHSHRNLSAAGSMAILPSPAIHQNTSLWDEDIIVTGGTVSQLARSRDNTTYYDLGFTTGWVRLSPGDYMKFVYTSAPTVIRFRS